MSDNPGTPRYGSPAYGDAPGTPRYGSPAYGDAPGTPRYGSPAKSSESVSEPSVAPSKIIMTEAESIILKNLHLLARSSKEIEMEMRIQNLTITLRDFNRVRATLERLGFQQMGASTKLLDIYIHKGDRLGRDNLSNLRFTLSDGQIPNYCQAGTFPLSEATLIYKSQVRWFESAFYESSGMNREQAEYGYGITAKQLRYANVDLRDYNIRVGTKLEIPFDSSRRQFYIRTKNPSFELREALDQANNTFSQFLSIYGNNPNFRGVYKTYRLKQRVSYQHPLLGDKFRFDMTVIKSSVDDKPVTDFIDANLIERTKDYEIECEMNAHEVSWSLLEEFMQTHMSAVLVSIQNHHIITRASDAYQTRENYKRDVRHFMGLKGLDILDAIRMAKQLLSVKEMDERRRIRQLAQLDYQGNQSLLKQLLYSGKSKDDLEGMLKDVQMRLETMNKGIREWGRDSTYFIVPKVKSLDLTGLDPLTANTINRQEMTVTDKADGITAILYVNNDSDLSGVKKLPLTPRHGEVVLIDGNLRVMSLGIMVPNRAGTIIVGEYIAEKGLFMAFDIYATAEAKTMFIADLTQYNLRSRLNTLKTAMAELTVKQSAVSLQVKEYVFCDETTSVFDAARAIWSKYKEDKFPYHLDGLIFTPDTPVGYTPGDALYLLAPSRTWEANLKWKPAEENTIDFYIVFEKDVVVEYRGRQSTTTRHATKPHNRDPTINRDYIVAKAHCGSRDNKQVRPTVFNPATPEIEGRDLVYVPVGPTGLPVSEDGEVVEDKTIVECRFDTRVNMWFAMRTRYDKTTELTTSLERQADTWRTIQEGLQIVQTIVNPANMYEASQRTLERLKGILLRYRIPEVDIDKELRPAQLHAVLKENMDKIRAYFSGPDVLNMVQRWGNDMSVALNVWNTIHYPVTETMICEGRDIPDIDLVMEKYYNRDPTLSRKMSLTYGLQNFHNVVIKATVILDKALGLAVRQPGDRLRLLDIGTGKGGDLNKWKKSGVDEVVGMDLFPSNINDPIDGAKVRYGDMLTKYPGERNPVVNFLVGDMTKNILSGEAFASESKEDHARLWRTPFDELSGAGGYEARKFNMMTAMFCMHYAFVSKAGVRALIRNIQENLADGGVFAGCCFDGKAIYRALEGRSKGGQIQGTKGGAIIWRLVKGYDDFPEGLPDSEASIGLPVNVYVANIGQSITEYLVNFDYFKVEMEKAGLIMDEPMSQMFAEIRLGMVRDIIAPETDRMRSLYNQTFILNNDNLMYMDKDESTFSDFNRVFVFRKVAPTVKKSITVRKTLQKPAPAPVVAPAVAPAPAPAPAPEEPSVATVISKETQPKLAPGDIMEEPAKPKVTKVIKKKKLKKDDLLADETESKETQETKETKDIVSKQEQIVEPPPVEPVAAAATEVTTEQALEEIDKVIQYLKRNDSNEPASAKFVSPTNKKELYQKRLRMIELTISKYSRSSAKDKSGIIGDKIKRLENYLDEMKSRK